MSTYSRAGLPPSGPPHDFLEVPDTEKEREKKKSNYLPTSIFDELLPISSERDALIRAENRLSVGFERP